MATFDIRNLNTTQPGPMSYHGQRPLVFLDIDDVLCVHRTLNTKDVLAVLAGDETAAAGTVWQHIFHRHAVENLRQLNYEFQPWYVISSSWTLHLDKEQLCKAFEATGLGFVADNLHEHWRTSRNDNSYRLVEIEAWLDVHARPGTRLLAPAPFVIIDDVLSGQSLVGSHLEERTVFCDAVSGFLYTQLKAAQGILASPSRGNAD